jgi:hypothetical protein
MRRARRLRLIVLVAACLGIGILLRELRHRRQRRTAMLTITSSLVGYSECMLGAPLAEGERTGTRLQRIELALPELPAPASPQDAWPIRCRQDLDRSHAALTAYEFLKRDPQLAVLDGLILRAHADPTPSHVEDLLDALLAAAAAVGIDAAPRRFPPPSRHLAPAPASPLTQAQLPPLPVTLRSKPDETRTEQGKLTLSFLRPREQRWTCEFGGRPGAPLGTAACSEAPAAMAPATNDSTIGFLRTARGRFDRFELVRPVQDSDPWVVALVPWMDTVALYHDQLVWAAWHEWHARTVPPAKGELAPTVDLGEFVGTSAELEACRTHEATVARLKSFDVQAGEHQAWMTMAAYEGGSWRRTPGSVAVDVDATFTCAGHEGTWTWFDKRVVTQVRCNADRCETRRSAALVLPWDVGGPIHTADLAGQTMIVGLGVTPSPFLGKSVSSVRMRLAPLGAIGEAPDMVLFGDEAHGGATVTDVDLFVRDGAAIVLLTSEGELPYRAIRIDPSGAFEPVKIVN